jgi:Fe-S-cluster containining protein
VEHQRHARRQDQTESEVTAARTRLALYAEADRATTAFANATGLACPTGCGTCCTDHRPHVTVDDVAAIAEVAVTDGTAEALLDRALDAGEGACVLYEPNRAPGGCTMYALRPLVCRLFGFAAVRDKHGAPVLATCHVHRATAPDAVARAEAAAGDAPVFGDLVDPIDAQGQQPINVALAAALDRALLRHRLGGGDGGGRR